MAGPYAEIALPVPVRTAFSYLVPEEMQAAIRPGSRVRAPFGARQIVGFVMRLSRTAPEGVDPSSLRPLAALLDREPLLDERALELGRQIAGRWFCSPGEALSAFLPAGVRRGARGRLTTLARPLPGAGEALRSWRGGARDERQKAILERLVAEPEGVPAQRLMRELGCSASPLRSLEKKGLIVQERVELEEDVFARLDIRPDTARELGADQARAAAAIAAALDAGRHRALLLHGVTGSGKTEVYLDAIGRCLARDRGAIVLVPEIALTPQTVERFASRFGAVAVLHSHLTDAERARQWTELRRGARRIAIGPRSAIFAPVRDLGLIVLDEEHETTFKQQNVPRYHARDVALMRGRNEDAVVVLGSATPALETYEAAERGEIERLVLPRRIHGAPMPEVSRIDMRTHRASGPGGVFSPVLIQLMRRNLDRGEQTLLFLNRRGFRTAMKCKRCGWTRTCRRCDVAMTFYRSTNRLLCHHCGAVERPAERCPECRAPDIRFSGFGTETVEHAVRTIFPEARVARMDGESMRARHAHETLFSAIKAGEIDVLIGTQMAAKGLDFPGITLIGVVSGDGSLLLPDFRSAERTFQLMTQVAGRAGRGALPGRVLIQTYSPEHYAFEAATGHDYESFAATELAFRRRAGYPPFGRLARAVFQGPEEAKVKERAERAAAALGRPAQARDVAVLGPSPAPLAFIKGQHRWHLVLRAGSSAALTACLEEAERALRGDRRLQVHVDVDPVTMM